jgi:hypothetical protein
MNVHWTFMNTPPHPAFAGMTEDGTGVRPSTGSGRTDENS